MVGLLLADDLSDGQTDCRFFSKSMGVEELVAFLNFWSDAVRDGQTDWCSAGIGTDIVLDWSGEEGREPTGQSIDVLTLTYQGRITLAKMIFLHGVCGLTLGHREETTEQTQISHISYLTQEY